jgi:hypothetical protein
VHRQIHNLNEIARFNYNVDLSTFKQATYGVLKNHQIPHILGATLDRLGFNLAVTGVKRLIRWEMGLTKGE